MFPTSKDTLDPAWLAQQIEKQEQFKDDLQEAVRREVSIQLAPILKRLDAIEAALKSRSVDG